MKIEASLKSTPFTGRRFAKARTVAREANIQVVINAPSIIRSSFTEKDPDETIINGRTRIGSFIFRSFKP